LVAKVRKNRELTNILSIIAQICCKCIVFAARAENRLLRMSLKYSDVAKPAEKFSKKVAEKLAQSKKTSDLCSVKNEMTMAH